MTHRASASTSAAAHAASVHRFATAAVAARATSRQGCCAPETRGSAARSSRKQLCVEGE